MENFNKNDYQELDGLQTSAEILYAIERVAGENFCYETVDSDIGSPHQEFSENAAFELWENGGREDEILAALPTENAEEGEQVFWGYLEKFAEFEGGKWKLLQ